MTKIEFINEIRKKLSILPREEVDDRINFYSEMIDDKIEDGYSEYDAVKEIGSVDDVVESILAEKSVIKLAKQRLKSKKRFSVIEVILLTLGSPIWLSLLIALIAVLFSAYVAVASVAISVWAVFISTCACSVGGVIAGIFFALTKNTYTGILLIGLSFVCAGIAILFFYACKWLSKAILLLPKKFILLIKKSLIKKEAV